MSHITLKEIDFGASDAESDDRLGEYFIQTGYVHQALTGKKTIFLGSKGSGKTALFKQLPDLYREQGREGLIVIPLLPDQYAWRALKQYKEQGILAESAHTNAWKLTLAITIASELVKIERRWGAEAQDAIETLTQFLRENYGDETVDLKSTATKLLTGLNSFNLNAFGFGGGFTKENKKEYMPTPQLINQLLELVSKCVREIGVVVMLDRLDDSWDGTKESKTILIGLLKAAKDLNAINRFSNDKGLQVITFLRSDIYPQLNFDDKDKHRLLEYSIEWTPKELAKMITKRLPDGVNVMDFLDPKKMRQSTPPFTYIVQRTFLRPREVIQYLTKAKDKGNSDEAFISKENIKDVEPDFSYSKVDDLKQEWSKVNPEFADCLESLRRGIDRYDSLAELEAYIAQQKPGLVKQHGAKWIVDQLFYASVIGVRPRSGAVKYRSEDKNLVLPPKGTFYIHRGLRKGLNITEKRGTTS